jgi:folate-binding protein YgfZ
MDDAPALAQQRVEEAALAGGRGYVPLPGWTEIELTGKDRAAFLHNFCTNDVKRLLPGHGCEAFILNVKGNILGHVLIFAGDERLSLSSVPGQGTPLAAHLDRYLIREDVQIADRTNDKGVTLLAGGAWEPVILESFGVAAPAAMYSVVIGSWQGVPVELRRVPLLHPAAWLLVAPSDASDHLLALLAAADGLECGDAAFTAARIASGYPWFGRDITDKNLPQEVARDPLTISFKKGCYLGQETVARIDALGHVNKLLCGLRFDASSEILPEGELRAEGAAAGTITSAVRSARLGHMLALALVRRERCVPGAKLASAAGEAEVVRLPLE